MKFTNTLAIFIIALTTAGQVLAQESKYSPLVERAICSSRLEVQAGPNFSNQTLDNPASSESNNFKPGINIGLSVYTEINDNISFNPGIRFEQRGTRNVYEYDLNEIEFPEGLGQANLSSSSTSLAGTLATNQTIRNETNNTLSYLSVPLMIGIKPIPKLKNFRVMTGLNPAILLGRKTKFESDFEQTGTDGLNTFDLGLIIGASYMLESRIGFNLFYDHGLINTVGQREFVPDTKSFNRTFNLVLFYRFDFNPLLKESFTKRRKDIKYNY